MVTVLTVLFVMLGFLIYASVRNNSVYEFRSSLITLFYKNFYEDDVMMKAFRDMPSYNEMVLSFKKLKINKWFKGDVLHKLQDVIGDQRTT